MELETGLKHWMRYSSFKKIIQSCLRYLKYFSKLINNNNVLNELGRFWE